MSLKFKNKPNFSGMKWGVVLRIALTLPFLLIFMGYANSAVIDMPKPLPDIVKSYKSVILYARTAGMIDTGVGVQSGDYITILAKGVIDLWPSWTPGAKTPDGRTPTTNTGNFVRGPKRILVFQLNEKVPIRNYIGPELIEVRENGNICLGYKDGSVDQYGKPSRPEDYKDNIGALFVDIIVWNTKDPNWVAKFLEEASLAQPKDEPLQEITQEFKQRLGLQKETTVSTVPSIFKMPRPLTDIVKNYKSITVEAGTPWMHPTGVQVQQGDTITFLAKGRIDLAPGRGDSTIYGPDGLLLFLLRENGHLGEYVGPELIEIKENGEIYLGYRGWRTSSRGEPLNPENFKVHKGSFSVDIIVWKKKDSDLTIKFLEQACLSQPDDKDLKELAEKFKNRQKEVAAATGNIVRGEKQEVKQDLPNSTTPILKMPYPLPDIVKSYKSVTLHAKKRGMQSVGLQVRQGECLTILAEGTINLFPGAGKEALRGPKAAMLFRFGNKEFAHWFRGPEVIETSEAGDIYLGYESSLVYSSGEPVRPEYHDNDIGAFNVDIVVWKKNDVLAILKFFDEASLAQPQNRELREMVQEFKGRKEVLSALEKGLAEKERKEAELRSQLERLEEKIKQPKLLPAIVVASPRDGTKVESEYISLVGVAEHEKGISRLEIQVNDQTIDIKDSKMLQLIQKGAKRIEFSERIRLREGQNKISLLAESIEGLKRQNTLSIELEKKREGVYAVVIGINKYKNFPSLKYAVRDAQEFYRYLVEVNRVPKDHVWLLLDEEATLDKLRRTLGTLLRQTAGKDDTVIIFLAGHGATEHDASSPDGDGLEKYILPHNADPKDLYGSAMPMNEIARIFQRISSERLVFIGDTCYSGGSGGRSILVTGRRANISGGFWERLSQGKGRVILTASEANEMSAENDELKHGVFTYYLLEGLRGKADLDGDGMITVDEIYRYVSMKVPRATGQNQHPMKKGETTGQIILGVVK